MAESTIRSALLILLALAAVILAAAPLSAQMASSPTAVRSAASPNPSSSPAPANSLTLPETVVEAKKVQPAASAETVPAQELETKPHEVPIQILNDLPGLVAMQHQGGGKAPQYLIRGFDADHGTDFAVFEDGMPVNLVSHAHGQGYSDINFIIPETIERLDFSKGPYYAKYGDFDNAGALDFVTRDQFDENFAHAEGGSWDTQRYVAGASPKIEGLKTLIAGQAYFTNGPFDAPEHDARFNLFGKISAEPSSDSKLSAELSLYHGRWDGSGQIPLREVVAQRLDRFGSEDHTEGGNTDLEALTAHYDWTPTAQDSFSASAYVKRYKLALFTDFTFYKDTGLRFIEEPDGRIVDTRDGPIQPGANYLPGDGIEQNDSRVQFGGDARYLHSWSWGGVPIDSEFGLQSRNDDIDLGLFRQVKRQRFFTINETRVWENSMAGYTEQKILVTEWLRFIVGLRGDIFLFDAHDRMPWQGPDPNFTPVRIDGTTTASIVSPKASAILTPIRDTDLFFNFGTGYHSNDARDAILTKSSGGSPLARSIGWEAGIASRRFKNLETSAAFWFLDLDSELVFNGDAGNQETGAGGNFVPSAATRRWGVDFQAAYQILDWLRADYDLAYADPRFRSSGEAIPLAPTLLMDGDLTVQAWKGLSAGLRLRFLDDRPAIEDRSLTARGYTLVDLVGKYRWKNTELSLQLLNLTDHPWREAQFSDNSCVRREIGIVNGCSAAPGQQGSHPDPPSDIHFTPGDPLTVIGGLTVFF